MAQKGSSLPWHREHLKQLFASGELADCKIKLKDGISHGHCVVLAGACVWFKKALCGNFKEATDKVVDLIEYDPDDVRTLLKFAYGYDYPECLTDGPTTQAEHVTRNIDGYVKDLRIHRLADNFRFGPLKRQAAKALLHLVRGLDFAGLLRIMSELERNSIPTDNLLAKVSKSYTETYIELVCGLSEEEHATMSAACGLYFSDVVTILAKQKVIPWSCMDEHCKEISFTTGYKKAQSCPKCSKGSPQLPWAEPRMWQCTKCHSAFSVFKQPTNCPLCTASRLSQAVLLSARGSGTQD